MNDIHTHTCVPPDHPSLAGHFPGRPIVPGVVLLDLVLEAIRQNSEHAVELHSIASTKFLHAVAPDTRVDMHIRFLPDEQPGRLKARFSASHANSPIFEGSFVLGIAERAS